MLPALGKGFPLLNPVFCCWLFLQRASDKERWGTWAVFLLSAAPELFGSPISELGGRCWVGDFGSWERSEREEEGKTCG